MCKQYAQVIHYVDVIQDLPQQEPNSVDCGVFVCKVIYCGHAIVLLRLGDKNAVTNSLQSVQC